MMTDDSDPAEKTKKPPNANSDASTGDTLVLFICELLATELHLSRETIITNNIADQFSFTQP